MKKLILDDIMAGKVICDTGQIDKDTRRALDKLERAAVVTRWRGHWYPVAGASWGLGPLKTCWALAS